MSWRISSNLMWVENIHELKVEVLPHYIIFSPQKVKCIFIWRCRIWYYWVLWRSRRHFHAIFLEWFVFLDRWSCLWWLDSMAILEKDLSKYLQGFNFNFILAFLKVGFHFVNLDLQFLELLFELVNDVLADGAGFRLTPLNINTTSCAPSILSALASILGHVYRFIHTEKVLVQMLINKLLLFLLCYLTNIAVQITLV